MLRLFALGEVDVGHYVVVVEVGWRRDVDDAYRYRLARDRDGIASRLSRCDRYKLFEDPQVGRGQSRYRAELRKSGCGWRFDRARARGRAALESFKHSKEEQF